MASAAASNEADSYIGQILGGRYRVERLLGHGGMGAVYLGTHTTIGGKCAIKVLSSACSDHEEFRQRFVDEAIAPNKLEHDGVIKIYDVGDTADGSLFLAMEFLDGEDLEQRLHKGGAMTWGQAAPIVRQLCLTLAAAHEAGIVHRDMKPANCFLVPGSDGFERVKILDFGIAKLENSQKGNLTTPGAVMGTPYYMPPEQARGGAIDHRADIYSVGAILYELLEGKPPYDGDNFAEILIKVVTEAMPLPTRAMSGMCVPDDLKSLLERVLAKNPDDRFQTMLEFADAIERVSRRVGSGVLSIVPPGAGESGGLASTLGPAAHSSAPAISGMNALSDLSKALDRATASADGPRPGETSGMIAALDDSLTASGPIPETPPAPAAPSAPQGLSGPPENSAPAASPPTGGPMFAAPVVNEAPLQLDLDALCASDPVPQAAPSRNGPPRKVMLVGAIVVVAAGIGLAWGAIPAPAGSSSPSASDTQAAVQDTSAPPEVEKLVRWSRDRLRNEGTASEKWRSNPEPAVTESLIAECKADPNACTAVHQVGEIVYHGFFGIERDHELAARVYPIACMHGSAAACYDAAYMLERGLGVPADASQARRYLGKGCMNNDPAACTELGRIHSQGRGVAIDLDRAQEYLWQGCKDGGGSACLLMGEMLERGKGGAADDVMAADYYGRACKADDVMGCVRLATMHDEGRGVEKDGQKARQLWTRACEAGHTAACRHAGR